jgi:hypothetical protein
MSKSMITLALVLLIFWSALIGGADYFVFGTITRQYLATGYKETQCQITQSEVAGHTLFHAGVSVAYSYTVNKKEYRGTRYRYDDDYSSSPGGNVVRRLPLWSKHEVYYNPDNPADSVLAVGLEGGDFLLFLFSIPVNVALLILWNWIIGRLREDWRVPTAGGVPFRRQNGKIRIWMGGISAATAALYGLGGAAFAAAFPTVALGGMDPGLVSMEYVLAAVVAVSVVAFFWALAGNASGKYDLLIDEKTRTLTLPRTCGRTQPITVERGELAGVCVQRRVSRLASGSYYSYLPALRRNDSVGSRPELLSPWGWTEQRALAFAEWLGQQTELEFKGVEEESAV